ncbi:MAG: hypothetical protein RLZZ450_5493 [Pseudomonadota bacterium]|jgi:uncharacterized protein (TIGR00730 family)
MRICVFCGSSAGRLPAYRAAAIAFGELLAREGIGLVYGGAHAGLMGLLADSVLAHGGEVVGVIPESLVAREIAHKGLTQLHVVSSMHERKAQMAALSDAFVALPGGIGTLEELFEVWTWGQLGLHDKPCALLNVAGFYDKLSAFLDFVTGEGFVRQAVRDVLLVDDDAARLLVQIRQQAASVPPPSA